MQVLACCEQMKEATKQDGWDEDFIRYRTEEEANHDNVYIKHEYPEGFYIQPLDKEWGCRYLRGGPLKFCPWCGKKCKS